MSEIYKRYNPAPNQHSTSTGKTSTQNFRSAPNRNAPVQATNMRFEGSQHVSQKTGKENSEYHADRHRQEPERQSSGNTKNKPCEKNACTQKQAPSNNPHFVNSSGFTKILHGLLPQGLYNPDTKKILGFLSAEDLLLIALIFLFLEDSEEDNPLLVLALLYLLLSEYFNLDDFAL